jgi:ribosomal subunit interface protein
MNIHITTQNTELDNTTEEYCYKKLERISKYLKNKDVDISVILIKTTNHHKKGEIYKSEIIVKHNGKEYHSSKEDVDIKKSFSKSLAIMDKELHSHETKKMTLFKKGAQQIKNLLKSRS